MRSLHQVRAVALTGYVEVARFVGLDPYSMLRSAGLTPSMLSDPEMRIPANGAVDLLEDSARKSGCQSFGLLMAECRTFESLGPIALLLVHLGSIREVLNTTIEYRLHINDIFALKLDDCSDGAVIRLAMLPQFAASQPAALTTAMTHILLRGASRGKWKPEVVHLRQNAPDDTTIFKRFFPAPIEFGSTFDGFECEPSCLDERWPWANETMAGHAARLLHNAELGSEQTPVSDRVTRSIALLLPGGRASLEYVATTLDSSPRTLQRLLNHEGSSFGELLAKARREFACRYLCNPSQSVSAVARLTGYASTSSFTRWFVSEFGLSPREWRESWCEDPALEAA